MDKRIMSSVLVLAMLVVVVHAEELVLQLNGEVRLFPESMIRTRIMRGVISPIPRVNAKGLRYFVQIARDNVVLIPGFGQQIIRPYGQRRMRPLQTQLQPYQMAARQAQRRQRQMQKHEKVPQVQTRRPSELYLHEPDVSADPPIETSN